MPHESLHCLWSLGEVRPLCPKILQFKAFKDVKSLIAQCTSCTQLANPFQPMNLRPSPRAFISGIVARHGSPCPTRPVSDTRVGQVPVKPPPYGTRVGATRHGCSGYFSPETLETLPSRAGTLSLKHRTAADPFTLPKYPAVDVARWFGRYLGYTVMG